MSTITKLCVHHFGPVGNNQFSSSKNLSEAHISSAHKARWADFPSKLNKSFIGYNFIIWPDGSFKQYRYIGEETAAAIGSNFDGIHVCLAGNFTRTVDRPTVAQVETLKKVGQILLTNDATKVEASNIKILPGTTLNLSLSKIYPHRVVQPNHTECYGNSLTDDWARLVIMTDPKPQEAPICITPEEIKSHLSIIQQIIALLMRLQDSFARHKFSIETLGSEGRSDEGVLTEESINKYV